jgi:regulator of cell morphogenesis and NO signaling
MSTYEADVPVWQLVRDRQRRAQILERFGIDYCCGGAMPLAEACSKRGIDLDEVRRALEESDGSSQVTAEEVDWSTQSMTALADHIVSRHHAYLRTALPRLGAMLEKVVSKHAGKEPNLVPLRDVYTAMWNELLNHMMKEELVLFPFVRSLDEATRANRPVPRFHCGSVTQPIHVMEDEHESTGQALRRMRELTGGFQPPADACETYRTLMAGLAELESDLHLHICKENNVLFPRAAAAEATQLNPAM